MFNMRSCKGANKGVATFMLLFLKGFSVEAAKVQNMCCNFSKKILKNQWLGEVAKVHPLKGVKGRCTFCPFPHLGHAKKEAAA